MTADLFQQVAYALGPVFLLIALGHILWRFEIIPRDFWQPAEKTTYFVFFPALLLMSAARAELNLAEIGAMMAAVMGATLLIAGLAILLKPRLNISPAGFTSFFQGAIRPNTYVGIGAAFALLGDVGLSLVAVCVLAVVPLVNLLCVLVLAITVPQKADDHFFKRIIWPVLSNPLIIACLLGAALNVAEVNLHPVFSNFMDILGRAALPVGLLAVGAGLDFKAAKEAGNSVILSSLIKLALLPAVTIGLLYLLGIEGPQLVVAALYAALPTSASSYVLARQMGGDGPMMAGIITVSTVLAILTMPVIAIITG